MGSGITVYYTQFFPPTAALTLLGLRRNSSLLGELVCESTSVKDKR